MNDPAVAPWWTGPPGAGDPRPRVVALAPAVAPWWTGPPGAGDPRPRVVALATTVALRIGDVPPPRREPHATPLVGRRRRGRRARCVALAGASGDLHRRRRRRWVAGRAQAGVVARVLPAGRHRPPGRP